MQQIALTVNFQEKKKSAIVLFDCKGRDRDTHTKGGRDFWIWVET